MEKINMMIVFLCLLVSMTFAQKSQNDLPINQLRKLDENIRESILLGFDNYTAHIPNGYKNYSISFNTFFLTKNWNGTYLNNNYLNNFTIHTKINNTDKTQNDVNFLCIFEPNDWFYYDLRIYEHLLVKYSCQSNNYIDGGIPKLINFIDDFSEGIHLNNSEKDSVSSSFEVFKKDLLQFKNKSVFENDDNMVWKNVSIISKTPTSFIINSPYWLYPSNNIQLLTNYYGNQRRIPCISYEKQNKTDDKYYYYLESKDSNYLTNTDLNYAVANITTQDQIFIIDFKKGENSTILPEKEAFKKKSGGLSTGGIIAIVIPAVLILLGVGALAFFLSRRAVPPPPVKNIANNTMGVVASSEAVVHQ